MNNFYRFSITACMVLGLFACSDTEETLPEKPTVELPATITQDRTLYSDTIYTFRSSVRVTNQAILTILPGTVIKSIGREIVVIDRGSKIMAEGTADQPIVFTSGKLPAERNHGDWGGLYILGRAPVSAYDENSSAFTNIFALRIVGDFGGGDDPLDNSGILRYVRIEFAGIYDGASTAFGLACVGVGSNTIIDHVQASYTQDSGFGFYGGTVNASHLVAFNNRVSGFVYANGYSGHQQFLVSYKHPYFAAAGAFVYTVDGMFVMNDLFNYPIETNTRPVLSNVTVIGPNNNPGYNPALPWNSAVNLQYGSTLALRNSVLMGMPNGGIRFSDDLAAQHLTNGLTEFSANLVHSNSYTASFTVDMNMVYSVDSTTVIDYALENENVRYRNPADIGLSDPFDFRNPDLTLLSTAVARTGADFSGVEYAHPFFEPVSYRGAFETTNWMASWTDFYPFVQLD